jgi:hypothetical protein
MSKSWPKWRLSFSMCTTMLPRRLPPNPPANGSEISSPLRVIEIIEQCCQKADIRLCACRHLEALGDIPETDIGLDGQLTRFLL